MQVGLVKFAATAACVISSNAGCRSNYLFNNTLIYNNFVLMIHVRTQLVCESRDLMKTLSFFVHISQSLACSDCAHPNKNRRLHQIQTLASSFQPGFAINGFIA